MPLTLCHVACSHYKPSGSRGPPACILSVCVYTSTRWCWCAALTRVSPQASGNTLSISWCSVSRPLLPPAHAGVIFIYYLLWQQREWRGVGESVLSVLKCLTIWMKFSMWRTRGRPCFFFFFWCVFYYLFPRRWWKDGEGRRDVQRERWNWQKERRPPNPPVDWSGLRPVCCGDRWGSGRRGSDSSGDLQHVTPPRSPWWTRGKKTNKKKTKTPERQSDETRGLPKWQERHLRRGSVSNMEASRHVSVDSSTSSTSCTSSWVCHQFCQMRAHSRTSDRRDQLVNVKHNSCMMEAFFFLYWIFAASSFLFHVAHD